MSYFSDLYPPAKQQVWKQKNILYHHYNIQLWCRGCGVHEHVGWSHIWCCALFLHLSLDTSFEPVQVYLPYQLGCRKWMCLGNINWLTHWTFYFTYHMEVYLLFFSISKCTVDAVLLGRRLTRTSVLLGHFGQEQNRASISAYITSPVNQAKHFMLLGRCIRWTIVTNNNLARSTMSKQNKAGSLPS